MTKTLSDFEFIESDHAAISSASKILFSRYRDFIDYGDIQQELYLWLFLNYDKAMGWRETLGVRHAERSLIKALRRAGERVCRAEKARVVGYVQEDEFFYSVPMVADLLSLYFDPEWMIPNGIELSRPPSHKPPQEGGNLVVMVADVGKAYESMPLTDQNLLKKVYGRDVVTSDVIAGLALDWGITYSAADNRVRRVVGRLRSKLGGPSPWGGDKE